MDGAWGAVVAARARVGHGVGAAAGQRGHLAEAAVVAYAEGRGAAAWRAAAAAHLAGCADCRERLAGLAEVAAALRSALPPVDDPAARAAIKARVADLARQRCRAAAEARGDESATEGCA